MHVIGDTPRRLRARLAAEDGFTMLLALAALLISSLLVTAAFVAAEGDIALSHRDVSAKKAYYAAQAGIDNYVFHLNRNSSYWEYCTSKEAEKNTALNQVGSTANRDTVPGASEEEYAVQLLPASTSPEGKCNPEKPTQTMIENGTLAGGTFRIESTGYSGSATACKNKAETASCVKRTLVATFSNAGLLNYIYYTKYETLDPFAYSPAKPQCAAFRASRPSECVNIVFVESDEVKGPLHTEDTAEICGSATFGRGTQDLIEFKGWYEYKSGCTGTLDVKGTLVPKGTVQTVEPPPSNASLKTLASKLYTGKTTITLTGETMTVTSEGKTTTGVAWPSNGVIYVANGTCGVTYTPFGPTYTGDSGCGNVYVKGEYTKSLTIAAENDIVVTGNLKPPVNAEGTPTTGATMGLIANNFVRVYHPLSGTRSNSSGNCNGATNSSEALNNPEIYAAILALNHSFIVDNYDCGAPLGKLNVYGAIAQLFRGPVGTSSGSSVATGYSKEYEYDDRLTVESPPYFLNPVKAAWKVRRQTLAPNP